MAELNSANLSRERLSLGGSALARTGAAPGAVEQPSLRNATTKVFKLPDGSYQAEIHSTPIHYQQPGGAWKEIDSTLVLAGKGSGSAYQNAANGFTLRFASRAASEDLVSLDAGKSAVSFGLEGASGFSQPLALGDTLFYGQALPGVDLSFQSLSDGVKESLLLASKPQGPLSFRFPISLLGVRAQAQADGSIALLTKSGKQAFTIPRIFMSDASGDRQLVQDKASLGLATDSGKLVLTLTPDQAWLADSARVYPVTIDPSIQVSSVANTYIVSTSSTPIGSASQLQSGSANGGATVNRALVGWDLSTLAGMTIQSADLSAWESASYSCTASQVSVYRVTSTWTLASVIWANQPTVDGTPLQTVSAAKGFSGSCPAGVVSFGSVLSTVSGWVSGAQANNGLELRAANESDSNGWKRFAAGFTLSISYAAGAMVPTNLVPADGTVSTSTTPTLSGKFNHSTPGTQGHLDFEVYRSSDNVLVTSGIGNTVAAGSTSSWTVAAGQLTNGTAYYWRARSDTGSQVSVWAPILHYTANRNPPVPTLVSPAAGASLPTLTPVLNATSVDPDGNPVSLQFQVSRNSGFTNIAGTSGWLPATTTFVVPLSWGLQDGSTYYWRAKAQDSLGGTSAWSSGRSFSVSIPAVGLQGYWPIWSHGPLSVNEVSGNLILPMPAPSYPTAAGSLGISLVYNLLDQTDRGLGPGWTLGGGPGGAVPIRLLDHGQLSGGQQYNAAELGWPDGSTSLYSRVGATSVYRPPAGEQGQLTKNPDGTWTFLPGNASIVTFNSTNANGIATLKAYEDAGTQVGLGKLSYSFSSGNPPKLLSMTDVDSGRTLTLTWNSINPSGCPSALLCVSGPDGVTWKYIGDANSRLFKVNDGTRDLVAISYDTSNRITKLQNANDLNPGAASPGYNDAHSVTIAYTAGGKVASVSDGPITGQTPSTST